MNYPPLACRAIVAIALSGVFALSVRGQSTPPPAEKLGRAADNKIYAQQLVNEMMAANPDLLDVGIHALRPGEKDLYIIADAMDIIGRKDAPNNLDMMNRDQTIIEPRSLGQLQRMAVHTPLRNSSGEIIGLMVFSFRRGDGIDKLTAYVRSTTLLAQLARRVTQPAELFRPAP